MNEEMWLKDLGPYAIVIIFALYIVLKDTGIIKSKGNDRRSNSEAIETHIADVKATVVRVVNIETLMYDVKKSVDDLYKWHDVRDNDGAFAWYVRQSLDNAINRLADNIADQTKQSALNTQALLNLANKLEIVDRDIKDIKAKV